VLSLDTHLVVKVPRPGDSEVTFSVFESRNPRKLLAFNTTLLHPGTQPRFW